MKVKILNSEGSTYPMLFCDVCDKVVDGSEQAEYLIPDVQEGEYGEIIVGHFKCTDPLEKKLFKEKGENYGNMSVGHLLYCLVNNTKTDFEKEKASQQMMEQLF